MPPGPLPFSFCSPFQRAGTHGTDLLLSLQLCSMLLTAQHLWPAAEGRRGLASTSASVLHSAGRPANGGLPSPGPAAHSSRESSLQFL